MQSYALQTVLSRMGHDVTIISKSRKIKTIGWKKIIIYPIRIIRKYVFHKKITIRNNEKKIKWYNRNEDNRCREIYSFLRKYLHIDYINQFKDIRKGRFDVIIVGSDQVWRPCYFEQQYKEPISNAFLSFAKDWQLKRYSYAASFGVENWEYTENDTLMCAELLSLFDGISVREESGVSQCSRYFGIDAVKLIDPTLLLCQEDYLTLLPQNNVVSKGNLLVYLLDETQSALSLVDKIVREENLVPFNTNVAWTDCKGNAITKPSVQTWLSGYRDADFVITDSYHACIFSILFNKPFVVVGNKQRGISRLSSLLSDFGLEHHLLCSVEEYCAGSYSLDKIEVESRLVSLRKKAMEFLELISYEK